MSRELETEERSSSSKNGFGFTESEVDWLIEATTVQPPLPSAMRLSPPQEFARCFKALPRSMKFQSLGTFDLDLPFTLQYIRGLQPIANGIQCEFRWFKERWFSDVHYRLLDDAVTVLRFRIVHKDSGMETAVVETAAQAAQRNRAHGSRTICNSVFILALDKCVQYLQALPSSSATETRLRHLLREGEKRRRCTESIGLFGFRNRAMYQFCLDHLQLVAQQKKRHAQ
ncbi:hypothetical protein BASA81_008085 [Batrachochytrium salamandrivorans]|nr:hypothetical protein BASA81_008085 [Batrachochytrium salamandrivorans]